MQMDRMQPDQPKDLTFYDSIICLQLSLPRGTQQDSLVTEHIPISREDVAEACSEISSWPGSVQLYAGSSVRQRRPKQFLSSSKQVLAWFRRGRRRSQVADASPFSACAAWMRFVNMTRHPSYLGRRMRNYGEEKNGDRNPEWNLVRSFREVEILNTACIQHKPRNARVRIAHKPHGANFPSKNVSHCRSQRIGLVFQSY